MLYLGIDLHLKQMTVSLRNQNGDVLLRRQVSTRWPMLVEFRKQLHQAGRHGEVCGGGRSVRLSRLAGAMAAAG